MKRQTGKKIHLRLLIAVFVLGIFLLPSNEVNAKSKKVYLSNKKITMKVGSKKTVRLKNAKNAVKWKISNKKKVKVKKNGMDKCKVTAKSAGKVTLTAIYKGKKYKCKITVKRAKNADKDKINENTANENKADENETNADDTNENKTNTDNTNEDKTNTDNRNENKTDVDKTDQSESDGNEKDKEEITVDATKYTYSIVPLLVPFNRFFYIKTDNPDPQSFRFVDKNSKYLRTNQTSYITTTTKFYSDTIERFCDVAYENEDTKRVKGGYIARGEYTDGGELVLQVKKKVTGSWGYSYMEFADTDILVQCADVVDDVDYLIQTYTNQEDSFFEKLDAVQKALEEISVYPRLTYDNSRPNQKHPYPYYARGYYVDQTYLLAFYENMYEEAGDNLAYSVYPYILSSLGFPGIIEDTAKRLNPDCKIESSEISHAMIYISLDEKKWKRYGGQGNGGRKPLYSEHVNADLFSFTGDADDFSVDLTLEKLLNKLNEYREYAEADAVYYKDLLEGDTYLNKVKEKGGTWLQIYGGRYAYARADGSRVCNVWVDGRYIALDNAYEPGASFEDYPTAHIVIRNMSYTDYRGKEHTEDVFFAYDEESGEWSAASKYGGGKEVPEEFILTLDEVKAMNIDGNKDVPPEHGLIYNGKVFPGTEF